MHTHRKNKQIPNNYTTSISITDLLRLFHIILHLTVYIKLENGFLHGPLLILFDKVKNRLLVTHLLLIITTSFRFKIIIIKKKNRS